MAPTRAIVQHLSVLDRAGLLRERLEQREHADVFASADTRHPTRLMRAGRGGPVVLFARNRVCALVVPDVEITSQALLDRLLDPALAGDRDPNHRSAR